MHIALVDYENTCTIPTASYDVIIVFVGSTQRHINITNLPNFKETAFSVIHVKDVASNNLDFHIAYYLHKHRKNKVTIYSRDKGYAGIVEFHNETGGEANIISPPLPESTAVPRHKQAVASLVNVYKTKRRIVAAEVDAVIELVTTIIDMEHPPTSPKTMRNHINHNCNMANLTRKEAVGDVIEEIVNIKMNVKL